MEQRTRAIREGKDQKQIDDLEEECLVMERPVRHLSKLMPSVLRVHSFDRTISGPFCGNGASRDVILSASPAAGHPVLDLQIEPQGQCLPRVTCQLT